MPNENLYRTEVKDAIRRSFASGVVSFPDVVVSLGSPDPRLVKELYDELIEGTQQTEVTANQDEFRTGSTRARRLTSALPLNLPAADPIRCQWWFTLETVAKLAKLAWQLHSQDVLAFLGAPTVGFFFSHWISIPISIFDADVDVLNSLEVPTTATKVVYDVANTVPHVFAGKHSVVVMDPPWYPDICRAFIARGRELLGDKGYILCTLPSRLTRPGIIEERTGLLSELLQSNFEVLSIDMDRIHYIVPDFEALAYEDVDGFANRPWRRGDLLVLRVNPDTRFSAPALSPEQIEVFSRNPKHLRFFIDHSKTIPCQINLIESIPEFTHGVSARFTSKEKLSVWGTNKRAAQLRDLGPCRTVLESWAAGKSFEETCNILEESGLGEVSDIVAEVNVALNLWPTSAEPNRRRSTNRLTECRRSILCDLAPEPSQRQYQHEEDGFRLGFQRDRDRILWSQSLRTLANKTQLFPVESDDQLRRRLSHSIEVMQLSATIANAFGLDRDLTEVGALAHDVGHPPFGHAGEHALETVLNDIDKRFGGFNHYEHGLDVVRWLEAPYRSPGAGEFPGLNLTPEAEECILKHTYYRGTQGKGQSHLVQVTKHKDMNDSSCHIEGQAVRLADKVSYLISDLEDGISVGAFDYKKLMACRFFERAPIDLKPADGESLLDRFISQRGAILKIIMEDVLTATDTQLASLSDLAAIRSKIEYVVNFSVPLRNEIDEVWEKLQRGILHVHPAVIAENMRAARIVRDLLVTYAISPALIEPRFLNSHTGLRDTDYMKWYKEHVGEQIGLPHRLLTRFAYEHASSSRLQKQGDNWLIPTHDLVLAKDYVASLTDESAFTHYKSHCTSVL